MVYASYWNPILYSIISPGGIQYWISENPIQSAISNINLNIPDSTHSRI